MINPGKNPASKGTRAVASDQTNTPIWRTLLKHMEKKKRVKHDKRITLPFYMTSSMVNILCKQYLKIVLIISNKSKIYLN